MLPNDTFETRQLMFEVDPKLSKPEIKRYLEAMYNLDIRQVNTLREYGKVFRNQFGKWQKKKDIKKAFIILGTSVTLPARPRPHKEWVPNYEEPK